MPDPLRRLLRKAGVELTRYPRPETLPWNLRRAIDVLGVDAVVDVGAHEGGFVHLLRDVVGFQGPILSLEPLPETFERLVLDQLHDPMWRGLNVAAGAESGPLDLNTYTDSHFNSFRTTNAFGHSRFEQLAVIGTRTVEVKRIDELDELPAGTLMLKTDTQGFDLVVMDGARGILNRVVAVLMEISARPIYHGAPVLPEMLAEMNDHGYVLQGLYPVTRGRDRVSVIEFDGLFFRI